MERQRWLQNDDPVAIVMSSGYQLWALWANKYKSNKLIEMLVKNLMQRQTGEGSWVSPNPRPPLEYYSFSATALMVCGYSILFTTFFKTRSCTEN